MIVDPLSIRGEQNFVPWEKRQIVKRLLHRHRQVAPCRPWDFARSRELIGRVRGYGGAVLREAGGALAPRRWMPGAHGSETLLDEEFLRRLERLSVFSQRSVKAGLIGEHQSVRKASSFEFADYRHYVPGDDFRRIDWNAYGRLEQLFLKLTEAKEDVAVHLLIDPACRWTGVRRASSTTPSRSRPRSATSA